MIPLFLLPPGPHDLPLLNRQRGRRQSSGMSVCNLLPTSQRNMAAYYLRDILQGLLRTSLTNY
jgi:hypothetical protein